MRGPCAAVSAVTLSAMTVATAVDLGFSTSSSSSSDTDCVAYTNMPGGDLPGMPTLAANASACASLCEAADSCVLYTFIDPRSPHAHRCAAQRHAASDGCCWLKAEEVGGAAPVVWDEFACSAFVRVPGNGDGSGDAASAAGGDSSNSGGGSSNGAQKTDGTANAAPRNVLYIVVDDLRNDLQIYGQNQTHNPNILKFGQSRGAVVFDNAYCQISVCSPSRLSFLSGRRPDHAGIYNFINHIRQADCGLSEGGVDFPDDPDVAVVNTGTVGGGCGWQGAAPCGGSGQCCSYCTDTANCTHWSYHAPVCHLKGGPVGRRAANSSAVSGQKGARGAGAGAGGPHPDAWTTFPQHFRRANFLTVHTGKIFHTEEGGAGNRDPDLNGPGMPPRSDPPSWSPGLFMPEVNAVANMWGTAKDEVNGVNATLDGVLPPGTEAQMSSAHQLADRVISNDAIAKLRLVSKHQRETGQPFFLAVGFRKPHLAFRFPRPWLQFLQKESDIAVAAHPVLNADVPPIAHCKTAPQATPFEAADPAVARAWRQHYYGAIAWMDSQVGRVLDELQALDLANNTMVVLHADHGWSLGEHGEWQKFSNFEHGTRVPLIMRVPWYDAPPRRSATMAELIDVFPTVSDVMGVPLPSNETFDGKSLAPVLLPPTDNNSNHNNGNRNNVVADADAASAPALRQWALSQFMRCPPDGAKPADYWEGDTCLFVDRAQMQFMGYTLRVPGWRYTEWRRWNASVLQADWSELGLVGVELYSHPAPAGMNYSFDAFENKNEAAAQPDVAAQLAAQLRGVVANQTRIPSLQPTIVVAAATTGNDTMTQ